MIKIFIDLVFVCIVLLILRVARTDYDKCYSNMEDIGIAVFGCCSGLSGGTKDTDYLWECCIDCPYFTLTDIKEKEKKND